MMLRHLPRPQAVSDWFSWCAHAARAQAECDSLDAGSVAQQTDVLLTEPHVSTVDCQPLLAIGVVWLDSFEQPPECRPMVRLLQMHQLVR